jgi:Secretion system C-terminal sorting domain
LRYLFFVFIMKKIITFLLLIIVNSAFSQPNKDKKRDNIWLFGYKDLPSDTNYGNTVVNFNTNPPTVQSIGQQRNLDMQTAYISDTAGQLIFYTNGQEVYNKNHQRMPNGIINAGEAWNLNFSNNETSGLGIYQGALALPLPNSNHLYKLFYTQVNRVGGGNLQLNKLLTATIDMTANNGLGSVINKDIPIWQNDTLNLSLLTSCRHANGRDWWILSHRFGLDTTYRFLLDPTGVHLKGKQHLQVHAPYDSSVASWHCNFSPDGSKYAIHNGLNVGVYLYDFDRCTGELSNKKVLWRPMKRGGVVFSPNSRYLYALDDQFVVQYDTDAPNIVNTLDTVGRRDTTVVSFGGYEVYFFLPQLAPDGKIYFNCAGSGTWLHTIENPDMGGDACDVHIGTVALPHWTFRTMPNFPNFRLGALRGSVCDTLGIEEGVTVGTSPPPEGGEHIRIFPNPANGILNVDIGEKDLSLYQYKLYDVLGRAVQSGVLENQISLKKLNNGIYFFHIVDKNGSAYRAVRVVVQHE